MRYIKPDYFDEFQCVAGNCPDTCCAGWQIMIDEGSLEQYGKVPGAFGRRLRNSIDWQEGCFYQNSRRCAFLNEKDLCDIYTELGEEALCDTCKNYPRHVEEYEGLRELSLSLSCPIAARMMLEQDKFPVFIEYQDDAEEELEEEFEEFDLMLFTQLEDARAVVMKHLQEAEGRLEEKLCLYEQFAGEMQDCIDREKYFEMDAVVRRYEKLLQEAAMNRGTEESSKEREADKKDTAARALFKRRKERYGYMKGLERLREEWTGVLEEAENTLYAKGEDYYQQCVARFQAYIQSEQKRQKQWEQVGTQLFVFFLYTYFCGAVYDDWIYSKMALAVESVRFIRELYMTRWLVRGQLTMEDYVELAYRYAREIEHSDDNLNELEEFFSHRERQ